MNVGYPTSRIWTNRHDTTIGQAQSSKLLIELNSIFNGLPKRIMDYHGLNAGDLTSRILPNNPRIILVWHLTIFFLAIELRLDSLFTELHIRI